jgi:hypothetical protein
VRFSGVSAILEKQRRFEVGPYVGPKIQGQKIFNYSK